MGDVLPTPGAQHLNRLAQDFYVALATDQIKRGLILSRAVGKGEHPAVSGDIIRRQVERPIEVGDRRGALAHLEQRFGT